MKRQTLDTLWPWLAALVSGIALSLAFPPFDFSWLSWIALAPLCTALWLAPRRIRGPGSRLARLRAIGRTPGPLLLGYTTGLAFFLLTFRWLIEVTGLGWFLLCLYLALFPAFWAWFVGSALRPAHADGFLGSLANLRLALASASAWVAFEWLRGLLFAWNGLGVAMHANAPFLQLASLTGVGGLSFLLAWTNVIAAATVIRFAREIGAGRLRPHFDFTSTMAMIVGTFSFGLFILNGTPFDPARVTLHVAAVQPAIPQAHKFDLAYENSVFEQLKRFTDFAIATEPDLLLWPEAATPQGVFFSQRDHDFMREIAGRGKFNFLLGSLDYEFADNTQRADFNAAVILLANGGDAHVYRKVRLVPFGEFIPFRHAFPLFAWIAGDQVPSDFSAGTEVGLFEITQPAPLKLAPLICFEDTFGEFARQPVLRGAHVLVNLTNDGWFNRSAGAEQHLVQSVFRAAENRRPLLRCANTGVTCFIDEFGRVRFALRDELGDSFAAGVLSGNVEVLTNPSSTFYTRHGDVFTYACVIFSALNVLLALATRRRVVAP